MLSLTCRILIEVCASKLLDMPDIFLLCTACVRSDTKENHPVQQAHLKKHQLVQRLFHQPMLDECQKEVVQAACKELLQGCQSERLSTRHCQPSYMSEVVPADASHRTTQ